MKLRWILTGALAIASCVFAQDAAPENHDLGYTDTPQLPGQRFKVHDSARPHPHQVTPASQPGGAPSDATVLFDGKNLDAWQVRTPARQRDRAPKTWKVENGYMEVAAGRGRPRHQGNASAASNSTSNGPRPPRSAAIARNVATAASSCKGCTKSRSLMTGTTRPTPTARLARSTASIRRWPTPRESPASGRPTTSFLKHPRSKTKRSPNPPT